MNLPKIILCFLILAMECSCSYRMRKYKTDSGKNTWARYYPDQEKRQAYKEKCIFKYQYKEEKYNRYKGLISSDTVHNTTYIQFDSARIYLPNEFSEYKNLFISGLVSWKMIVCPQDSLCKLPERYIWTNAATGEPITEKLWGYDGRIMRIGTIKELKELEKQGRRRFEFTVTDSDGFTVYFLELKNENVSEKTDLENFLKNAEVTFLINGWSEI